ncbi:MAG TPA: tetratricopeptide repeat protein [Candidatus Angelobacter sp.]
MLNRRAQFQTIAVTVTGIALCWCITPTATAQNAIPMSDRQACMTLKSVLPTLNVYPPVHYTHFNKGGITRIGGKHDEKSYSFSYNDIQTVDSPNLDHQNLPHVYIMVNAGKQGKHEFKALNTEATLHGALKARLALLQFAQEAHEGRTINCSDDPNDYAGEQADFEQKAAAWRALATKPSISEEVYKDRLLAEDALKNKDLNSAAFYYETGVTSDPTWAQGWYNVALVYAELGDYFEAARCMKRYVILIPDAQDARAAKDNIILWEARASQQGSPPR